ncbi:hypothetical protein E2C01_029981 [Portunus trituberculatus]|uniref:Uncharacterized protein n=1 Tax=Portunus trituberculatus TaxID=210409 RepID=A0A5B7ETW5_PORTR|nr:hypothetical protein [Portunus trituberculatus]
MRSKWRIIAESSGEGVSPRARQYKQCYHCSPSGISQQQTRGQQGSDSRRRTSSGAEEHNERNFIKHSIKFGSN